MSAGGSARIGVDIGGTFTDLVLRRGDGSLQVSKVSSTPDDPGRAVVHGLERLLREARVSPAEVAEVVEVEVTQPCGFRRLPEDTADVYAAVGGAIGPREHPRFVMAVELES
jgi:predicted NBD/HSP70 family sugar kinase